MKKLIALFLFVSLAGCQTGMIRADAIDGSVRAVADRHDAYVQADQGLSDTEKQVYLRTTELLRRVLDEAKK